MSEDKSRTWHVEFRTPNISITVGVYEPEPISRGIALGLACEYVYVNKLIDDYGTPVIETEAKGD